MKINYKNRNPCINQKSKNEIRIIDKLFLLSIKKHTQQNNDNCIHFKNINLSNQRKADREY